MKDDRMSDKGDLYSCIMCDRTYVDFAMSCTQAHCHYANIYLQEEVYTFIRDVVGTQ